MILSPASICTGLDLADSSRQLSTTQQRPTSPVGKFSKLLEHSMQPKQSPTGFISPCCRSGSRACMGLGQTLPCTRTLLGGEQPRVGSGMCQLPGPFPEGQEGHRCPVPPVPGGAGSCLQAAVTAECLCESCHQASRSVEACTGSNRWVYFSKQVVQVVPLRRILIFFLSVFRVFIFSLSAVP